MAQTLLGRDAAACSLLLRKHRDSIQPDPKCPPRPGAVAGALPVVDCNTAGQRPGNTYVVKPGDTLAAIAARHGTDVGTLLRLNEPAEAECR